MKLYRMLACVLAGAAVSMAQPPDFGGFGGPGGPGGRGGRGPGGFGGPMNETRKLLSQFDKNGDGVLNTAERKAAREFIAANPGGGGFGGRRGGFGRGGMTAEDVKPGPKLSPDKVKIYKDEPLYDANVLRTLFLEFEDADWEQELTDFYKSDVEVPAKLTVDGKVYPNVGVHFRGMTSFMFVTKGKKHSINLSMNLGKQDQRLNGYRTLNLLNANSDPTYLRTVLYQYVARQYFPAPKANYVRVVINGESWGPYINVEQFNSDFTQENFGSAKGTRWKVLGSPGGQGGLNYKGDDVATYKRSYEIKTKDDPKAWADLIKLCKVLSQTPPEQLEKALEPLLDIDGALRFLAVDKVLINNDGYWVRSSDYSLYQDPKGRFHVIPQDANETLREVENMGGGRGRGAQGGGERASGVKLPPFTGADDPEKALYNLVKVPALRARYLSYVRDIAEKWLDWNKLGPLARQLQAVIAEDIKTDTKKLDTTENFTSGLTQDRAETAGRGGGPGGGMPPGAGPGGPDFPGFGPPPGGFGGPGGPGGFGGPGGDGPQLSVKGFVDQRRAYLLGLDEVKGAAKL
ncbi:MAG: CotH kinase family protein [Candidatus Solibacter sp.]